MLNGNNLHTIRAAYGLGKTELARLVGVSHSYIVLVESGERKLSEKVRNRIIDALELTQDKVDKITELESYKQRIINGKER